MIVDNIPQLQAQIQQISLTLQNAGVLPVHVRQQAEMQHQQLQMQLAHAQTIAAALAAAQSSMGTDLMMPMGTMPMMNQGFGGPQMQQQQLQQLWRSTDAAAATTATATATVATTATAATARKHRFGVSASAC